MFCFCFYNKGLYSIMATSSQAVGCNNRQSKHNMSFYAKTHRKEEEMEMDDGRSMEILSAICIRNKCVAHEVPRLKNNVQNKRKLINLHFSLLRFFLKPAFSTGTFRCVLTSCRNAKRLFSFSLERTLPAAVLKNTQEKSA